MSSQMPTVVIVSSSNTKPKSLIKLITKHTGDVEDESDPNKVSQRWKIDTKYYTADVAVCGINEQYKRSEEFNSTVEALIVHLDTNKETGLEELQKWEEVEKDCEPDIKILLTNYCTNETKINRAQALEWCLKRGYELIELYPNTKNKPSDDQDLIEEKVGVDRVVEVLQTHIWSNLVMKDRSDRQDAKVVHEEIAGFDKIVDGEITDDFTELFSQLQMMKESLQSMPMRERKQCAEQMVTAFWHAIGGDEEEILDI